MYAESRYGKKIKQETGLLQNLLDDGVRQRAESFKINARSTTKSPNLASIFVFLENPFVHGWTLFYFVMFPLLPSHFSLSD